MLSTSIRLSLIAATLVVASPAAAAPFPDIAAQQIQTEFTRTLQTYAQSPDGSFGQHHEAAVTVRFSVAGNGRATNAKVVRATEWATPHDRATAIELVHAMRRLPDLPARQVQAVITFADP